jgi:hypothetical protein
MKYFVVAFFFILNSCSIEKKLIRKQKKVSKLEWQIDAIKKELNLPLDSTIINVDTFIIERKTTKFDTIKLKCNESNEVVFFDNNEPLNDSEIVTETEYIEIEKVIQKDVLKTKKEIIYIEKKLNKKQLALLAIGFVTLLIGLMYALGSFAGFIIKILINKKNLI